MLRSARARRTSVAVSACCALTMLYASVPSRAGAARRAHRSATSPEGGTPQLDSGVETGAPHVDGVEGSKRKPSRATRRTQRASADAGAHNTAPAEAAGRSTAPVDAAASAPARAAAGEPEEDEGDDEAGDAEEDSNDKPAPGSPSAPHATDGGDAGGDDDDADADADAGFGFGAEVEVASRYIWRGIAFTSGPVVEPSVWGNIGGLNLEVWSNVLLTNEPQRDRMSALEPAVSYTFTWGRLKLEPGAVLYYTPREPGPRVTTEATLDASFEIVDGVHLLSGTNVDVEASPGAYFGTFGADYELKLHNWTFKGLLEIGWATANFNNAYFDVDSAALDLIGASISVRYDLTDLFYLSLHGDASTLLSPVLRQSVNEPTLGSVGAAVGLDY